MNDSDIQSVFPDLTAPSHIKPFLPQSLLPTHHQFSVFNCFAEKGLNFIITVFPAYSYSTFFECLVKAQSAFLP